MLLFDALSAFIRNSWSLILWELRISRRWFAKLGPVCDPTTCVMEMIALCFLKCVLILYEVTTKIGWLQLKVHKSHCNVIWRGNDRASMILLQVKQRFCMMFLVKDVDLISLRITAGLQRSKKSLKSGAWIEVKGSSFSITRHMRESLTDSQFRGPPCSSKSVF